MCMYLRWLVPRLIIMWSRYRVLDLITCKDSFNVLISCGDQQNNDIFLQAVMSNVHRRGTTTKAARTDEDPTMTQPQTQVASMTLQWLLSSSAAVNPVHAPVTAGQADTNLVTIQGGKRLFLGFPFLTMVMAGTVACAINSTPEVTTIVLRCSMKHHTCCSVVMYCIGMPVVTCMLQQFTWNVFLKL